MTNKTTKACNCGNCETREIDHTEIDKRYQSAIKFYLPSIHYQISLEIFGFRRTTEILDKFVFPVYEIEENTGKLFVEYYATREKFIKNNVTRIKLGRFIKKFEPSFNAQIVQDLQQKALSILTDDQKYRLTFSLPVFDNDSDQRLSIATYWREVYKTPLYADPVGKTTKSCMTDKKCASAYACEQQDNGLLLLAVLLDASDNIVSRTIVFSNCNDKIENYLRIYSADKTAHAVMIRKLNGYGIMLNSDLAGRYIYSICDDTGFPYLDGYSQSISDYGKHIYEIEKHGDYGICDNTNGSISLVDTIICDHCGDQVHQDYANYGEDSDITICDDCINNGYYTFAIAYCRYDSDYRILCRTSDCVVIDDQHYYDDADSLSSLGFTYVDYDDQWFDSDEVTYCETTDEYCHNNDVVELDSELYPNLDQDEANYPCWASDHDRTALGHRALIQDMVYIENTGKHFHPYELLLYPDQAYDLVKTEIPTLNNEIVKAIIAIRDEHTEDFIYELDKNPVPFTKQSDLFGDTQLELTLA